MVAYWLSFLWTRERHGKPAHSVETVLSVGFQFIAGEDVCFRAGSKYFSF